AGGARARDQGARRPGAGGAGLRPGRRRGRGRRVHGRRRPHPHGDRGGRGHLRHRMSDRAADAVAALRRVAYCLDRVLAEGHRVQAYLKAADVLAARPPGELEARHAAGTLTELPGIGKKTASIASQALDGGPIPYLDELEATTQIATSEPGAAELRDAI